MQKRRKPFVLLNDKGEQIGHGVAYDQGNVQVYMDSSGSAAWQMQLVDVLSIKDVVSFKWGTHEA